MSVTPNRREEYEQLCRTIQNWNENRLELFEISQPKETLEFEGVMRFYFQSADGDGQKVATKCIRVSSTTTTVQVVEALVQKFRPDLRMLTTPSLYTLYEVHADGEERMLDKDEHPLWVQLNWVEGNREGRFLLKKMTSSNSLKLSSKKDKKNKEDRKKSKNKQKAAETPENDSNEEQGSIARSLYTDMPESRLTRSVSLKQGNMRVVHREPGSGADSGFQVHVPADLLLSPDTPCKPLPIGDRDTAAQIVRSAVEKYEIPDDPAKFCLVQVSMPNDPTTPDGGVPANVQVVEKVLEDTDLPLLLYSKWAMTNGGAGALQFQLRRRASFNQGKALGESPVAGTPVIADLSMYPILVEVIQGSVGLQSNPRTYPLMTTPAELGSDPKCCVRLTSGGIRPRHCTIASSGDRGTFTVAPLDKAAAIQVNNKLVRACTALPNSAILKLGDTDTFQFLVPLSTSNKPRPVPPPNAQESCRNSRQGQPGAPNLSKAFSSEDILNPSSSSSLKRPLKERAFSEYHLPGDGTPKGQGSTPESDTPAVESKGASIASVDALEWAILPASLFFYHAKGSLLLQTLILEVEGYTLQFKLGPAFALYMMARCYLSPDFQPGVSTSESKKNLVLTLKNVATNIKRAIKVGEVWMVERCVERAASVLRSTGKTITLTVSKHAAHYLGLQALISHDSPRNTRQDMNIPEGTSHAQKAKRRERRERERAQQQYGGDPRLDSRRGEDVPERSTASLPPQHQHLAKWFSGQRGLVRGHDDDHRSSTSTLSNIPEQERLASPGPSSLRSGTGEGRHSISTPPIRDSGLTRPRDSDSSTFSSLVQLETASMEASTRYSDYSQELEYHRQPLPAGSAVGQSHLHGNPLTYGDTFNLSSQSALQSQSFPPATMSQQRVTAQDRLSMDVLQHTQPSSASLSGVGAVLAKVKASSAIIGGKDDAHFLLSSDLKDLEMDDIELEKQRIHLLLYEEQKEKELTTGKMKELFLEQENKVSEEELHLRKELLSIEDMIVQQKKKLKDLKYNREREERRLKETEKQLQDIIVQTALLTGDQQRQLEQKQRQSELEQRKRDHDKRVQCLLGNEHASKMKVLALECNAKEIREQLQKYEKCPQKEEVASKTILMVAPRQDDEFSSDIPRPGSPVMREGMQMKLPEQLDAAAERRINPSWSAVPGLSTTRDTSSRGTAHVSKAMSVSDLSEPSEDGDSRPAKLSVAYDNASRPNPPRTSEQYSYRSHSRDEIDDISRGHACDSYERPRIEGVLAPSAGEHAFNPPISPQQLRGDGRYYRGHEAVGAGRSSSSSAWYQSSIQPPHSFQRPSSANSRSDSPSAYNRPDRPDQGPPSAYSRPDQGPSNTYNQPDQGLSNTYRLDQGPPITYNRFDQGPPNPYNRSVAGRSDQQAPGGFQNRMEQSPALNLPGRSEQGISGTGSRPGSAFSDHRSDLEPARMGTVSTSSRPDTNGRLGHHYSRQTKSRVTQRSLNQSSSTDNLIATTETVGIGSARQVGTPDVVPSVRGERPTGVAGRAPESSTQTLPSVRTSRENHVALSSGDISSPRLPHGKHESDIPPVAPGGERMRVMTFSGISNLAPRPSRGYEQVLPQQGRAIPQGYLHDQKSYGQVTSPQPKPYELVAPTLQSNPHELGRSYSAAQGRPYEQGQQGREDRTEQPLPQGRSYDQAPWPQGRPYEQVMQAQRKSHDNVSSHQGRPYDQAPVAQQGTQGRPYEQVALAQGRAHDTEPTAQGRSYDPVTTQRRSYEQFVLPPQGKPQEQSWVAQPPLPGRPYESSTLQAGQLQGQRPAPYERTFLGGDILNVGRNPVGYPSKTGSHSYSRRRPDPPQQVMMTLEDKMKHYIEGMEEPSYPDRIQRQQTEL
eukprot:Em0023g741a